MSKSSSSPLNINSSSSMGGFEPSSAPSSFTLKNTSERKIDHELTKTTYQLLMKQCCRKALRSTTKSEVEHHSSEYVRIQPPNTSRFLFGAPLHFQSYTFNAATRCPTKSYSKSEKKIPKTLPVCVTQSIERMLTGTHSWTDHSYLLKKNILDDFYIVKKSSLFLTEIKRA